MGIWCRITEVSLSLNKILSAYLSLIFSSCLNLRLSLARWVTVGVLMTHMGLFDSSVQRMRRLVIIQLI